MPICGSDVDRDGTGQSKQLASVRKALSLGRITHAPAINHLRVSEEKGRIKDCLSAGVAKANKDLSFVVAT